MATINLDSQTSASSGQIRPNTSILDSIKTGLKGVGGKIGKAADTVLSALPIQFPQVSAFGPQGLTGYLESQGSAALTPAEQAAKVTTRTEELNKRDSSLNLKPVYTSQNIQYALPQDQQSSYGDLVNKYKASGWNDEAAIKADIAARAKSGQPQFGADTGSGGDGGAKLDTGAIKQSVKDSLSGKYLGDTDIDALLKEYQDKGITDTNALAADIESRAAARAEREYNTILDALRVQKGESEILGKQQKEDIESERTQGQTELSGKKEKDIKGIEKQQGEFLYQTEQTADTLARNWKDMSLQVQRIMRARGAQDSSFAAGEETKVLGDFNKGLRQLAVSKTNALSDFADAVNETVSFYAGESSKLDDSARKADRDVDNWLRQQVQNIQAQEGVALNKKLADIDAAVTQADQLKINMNQKIQDQKLAYGLWLAQSKKQLEQAVALAAINKVGSAQKSISDYTEQFALTQKIIASGGEIVTQNAQGQSGVFVHGKVPATGEDLYIPVTQAGGQALALQQAANATKNLNTGDQGVLSGITPGASIQDTATQLGYGDLLSGKKTNTPTTTGGLDETIRGALGM